MWFAVREGVAHAWVVIVGMEEELKNVSDEILAMSDEEL